MTFTRVLVFRSPKTKSRSIKPKNKMTKTATEAGNVTVLNPMRESTPKQMSRTRRIPTGTYSQAVTFRCHDSLATWISIVSYFNPTSLGQRNTLTNFKDSKASSIMLLRSVLVAIAYEQSLIYIVRNVKTKICDSALDLYFPSQLRVRIGHKKEWASLGSVLGRKEPGLELELENRGTGQPPR